MIASYVRRRTGGCVGSWPLLALPLMAAASGPASAQVAPQITLSIEDREFFARRDEVDVGFRTDVDGYVTIFRVDTDGRVRVLYPRDPWSDNFVRADHPYAVPDPYGHSDAAFVVDDYAGVGYLLGIVSRDPFVYSAYVLNDHWDYRTIANRGRISGDPYVALVDIVERMVPPGYTMYGLDIVPYFVERRYDYPRFLCYDCHRYAPYPVWDPYRDWCGTFRIVIYDDVRRYPTRIYPATDVVVPPAIVVEPRYVFQPRTGDEPFVTRTRRNPDGGRVGRGATGRDVGGVGSVPVPARRQERGGLGGFIRRIFGGDDDRPDLRRVVPDSVARKLRPTLERRGGEQGTSERRPDARRPETSPPARRPATPAAQPSSGRRPASANPARRPPGTPRTRRPTSQPSSRRPGS